MDGFHVVPMAEAVKLGEVFCTVTGNKAVIRKEHFQAMRDGAIVANSGHFNVELDLDALAGLAKQIKKGVRENVDAYHLSNGRVVYVLGQGRLVNLACAEGHPAQVMDMSFATQALASEWASKSDGLAVKVHDVPMEIEEEVASVKLASMGIKIDTLTKDQEAYLSGWEHGT